MLNFLDNVHPHPRVTCHVSCVMSHLLHVKLHFFFLQSD